ncbi:MAG TPA: ankyrin repeat domain-containing protein [Thermoanaerobaculia bacterium]|nr:ankyrin repeat domain-containing protein [Thermoanaerobaculia bacterium]
MRHRFWASLALALAVLGAGALGMAGWFLPQRNAALAREGWPDLVIAAREGRSVDVAALVTRGADPDRYDTGPNRWTPLLHAVHKNQLESVRALLAAGADVNKPAPNGLTPLAMAANQGEAEIVDELLAAGADPGARSSHGWTPLQQAVARGDERIVRSLLREDPGLELGRGWRAWSVRGMAVAQGRGEVLDLFAPHQEASK